MCVGGVQVDVVVSTIGFPLVGGPAGTMEGGRQAEVAQEILRSKNVPYFVAAPLLIQDLKSWTDNGVAGLQSVVRMLCVLCMPLSYACRPLNTAISEFPLHQTREVAPEIRIVRICAVITSAAPSLTRRHLHVTCGLLMNNLVSSLPVFVGF